VTPAGAIPVSPGPAAEYPAGRYGRFDGWVKEARQTELSFWDGRCAPGTVVKRRRHSRRVEWLYRRGAWGVEFGLRHPPDHLLHGHAVEIPISLRVITPGDVPLDFAIEARLEGIRGRERRAVTRGRLVKTGGHDPLVVPASVRFTPRLDWDDRHIRLVLTFDDHRGTSFTCAEIHWWSNVEPRPPVPRRRARDPRPP
jgi:hypothetical protein